MEKLLEEQCAYSLVIFSGVPIPPSVNKQYKTIIRRNRFNRLISTKASSKDLVSYRSVFQQWALINARKIQNIKNEISKWKSFIECELYFAFNKDKLFTKQGKAKKIDTSNRDKALLDLLSTELGFDDSHFNVIRSEKIISKDPIEQVYILLRPSGIRTAIELEKELTDDLMDSYI